MLSNNEEIAVSYENSIKDKYFNINTEKYNELVNSKNKLSVSEIGKKIVEEDILNIFYNVSMVLNKIPAKVYGKNKDKLEALGKQPFISYIYIAYNTLLDIRCIDTVRYKNILMDIANKCEVEYKCKYCSETNKKLYNGIKEKIKTSCLDFNKNWQLGYINELINNEFSKEDLVINFDEDYKYWLANMLVDCIIQATGLFELHNVTEKSITNKYINPTQKLLDKLDEYKDVICNKGGRVLPLPVVPKDWVNNIDGGYYTDNFTHQKMLIKNYSKEYQKYILKNNNKISKVLEAVNIAQHSKWCINTKVLDVLKKVVALDYAIEGLPKDNLPLPKCPYCGEEVHKNHRCFKDEKIKSCYAVYKQELEYVKEENSSNEGKRVALEYGLNDVEELLKLNEFYYVYQCDFRGRMYPQGSINPQGSDWVKGILQFKDGYKLGKSGVKWLKIHTANCYGKDKLTYDERIQWVADNIGNILGVVLNPLTSKFWQEADAPFEFLAACYEMAEAHKYGKNFVSHLPIAVDGSCSGTQHWSALLFDEVGALSTNVINRADGRKADIYTEIANKVKELVENETEESNLDIARFILKNNIINRKLVKKVSMTYTYGAKFYSCLNNVTKEAMVSLNKLSKAERTKIINYLASKVWEAPQHIIKAARKGMDYLTNLSSIYSKYVNKPFNWVNGVGMPISQSYYNYDSGKKIKLATGGEIKLSYRNDLPYYETSESIHIRKNGYKDEIDSRRQKSGIAPNFIHSMDASVLMLSVIEAHKKLGITDFALIHDSLAVPACYMEEFHQILNDTFYDMYNNNTFIEDVRDSVIDELKLTGMKDKKIYKIIPELPEKGNLNMELVKQSNYLFS